MIVMVVIFQLIIAAIAPAIQEGRDIGYLRAWAELSFAFWAVLICLACLITAA